MNERGLSRRQFLWSGVIVVAGTASARLSWRQDDPFNIQLNGVDGEIWAWQHAVSGEVGAEDCDAIELHVNGSMFPAMLSGTTFTATIPLQAGENVITALCRHTNGQETMSESVTLTGMLRDVPRSNIHIELQDNRIIVDGTQSEASASSASPVATYLWTTRADNPAPLTIEEPVALAGQALEQVEADRLVLSAPAVDGEYYITLQVTDANGSTDKSTTYFRVAGGEPELDDWDTENTDWVESTVVYGTIPRNFGSPGFQAVIDRLDYLADLGINALWLAPVNDSPAGDYGYAVVNYFEVDGRYGTNDDFRRMVDEAHARGIRVLMDFVPNHSSSQHPYFEHALSHGTESPYWDFYDRDESGSYTYYFDWRHLPNLNYENPGVRRWMLEAFEYWVREYDVDGFRVDVAWGIRERRPDFWIQWRRALKRIKPDLLLLAEASARDEYYFTNGFDAAYDWTGQLGKWAWELVWEGPQLLTFNLNAALTNLRNGFHPDALIFRFLNNNDTGARFVTRHGVDMTRVATALLLTLPGIPCVFTGDEVGEAFTPYGDSGSLSWREQYPGLIDYHRTLITLRRTTPSLYSREFTILQVEPHVQVYGYLRYTADGSDPLLVLLNFSNEAHEVEVTLPDEFSALGDKESFEDLITGEQIAPVDGSPLKIPLPAMRAVILR